MSCCVRSRFQVFVRNGRLPHGLLGLEALFLTALRLLLALLFLGLLLPLVILVGDSGRTMTQPTESAAQFTAASGSA